MMTPPNQAATAPESTGLGFRPDRKITDVLASRGISGFTISAEVIPPRNGAEQGKVLSQIQSLVSSGAEFLSVTKGAGGSLRGGSLPIAQTVKEQLGVPCIAHFTCRDLTPADIENQLMDHHYFGVRNILALRGDPPQDQPEWKPKDGAYNYAYQLISQIRDMNLGKYLARPSDLKDSSPPTHTEFCIGAAAYPEHADENERLEFFRKKVEAGAEYAITQMIFDADAYGRFLAQCDKAGLAKIPVIPGTRLVKTRSAALRMSQRFGVSMPEKLLNALPEADGPGALERAVEVFYGLIEEFRSKGAPGVHLFVLSDTVGACRVLDRFK